jgi:hypothetical protein
VTTSKYAPLAGYSRGDINRAGAELRRWWLSNEEEITASTSRAIAAMVTFRETFQLP